MNMTLKRLSLLLCFLLPLISGCAAMRSDYDPPGIALNSFRLLPSNGISPRFEIGLQIINPNPQPLSLLGIVYDVFVEDEKILMGVANDLPAIEAYGQGDVLLEASANILGGVKLIGSLINTPRDAIKYTFRAKLDVGTFGPPIKIVEEGYFSPLENR